MTSVDRSLVEDCPHGLALLRDGDVVTTNPSLARLLGQDAQTLKGRSFVDLVVENDRSDLIAWIEAAANGEEASGRLSVDVAGERRVLSARFVPSRSESGDVVATCHDVTERVAREADLERDREMLTSLLENVPLSIYFKDRESRHERVSHHMLCTNPDSYITNQEGKKHAHPDDVVGKTDFDLYAPAFAESAVADDEHIMAEQDPVFDRIAESTTSLGETIVTSTTKAPRYDDAGNVIGLVGVTMDVTERHRHERELERQNRQLEAFTEVLTHDLRNPLSVAAGYLDLLESGVDQRHLEAVRDAHDRMARLIDDTRAFVLEGRPVDDPGPVDLGDVAREAWRFVDTGEATLRVDVECSILADVDRIGRVFENLYRNSVDHSDDSVTVSVGELDDERGFFVEDDGPGIPDTEREVVFERGYSTGEGGTGFGLAIVATIAEAHGWSVTATEGEAGGARFEFADVVETAEDGVHGKH